MAPVNARWRMSSRHRINRFLRRYPRRLKARPKSRKTRTQRGRSPLLPGFAPGSVAGPDMMGNRDPLLCCVADIDSGQSNSDMGSLEMCESSSPTMSPIMSVFVSRSKRSRKTQREYLVKRHQPSKNLGGEKPFASTRLFAPQDTKSTPISHHEKLSGNIRGSPRLLASITRTILGRLFRAPLGSDAYHGKIEHQRNEQITGIHQFSRG